VYALINHHVFGLWLPVSGMAKDLKIDHGFTLNAIGTLQYFSKMQLLNFGFIFAMMLALPKLWKWVRPAERTFVAAALTFPFVYMFVLSWVSDWPLWSWYFYGLRPALCVAILVLLQVPRLAELAARTRVMAVLVLVTVLRIASLKWDPQLPDIADAAAELQTFAATHPGTYAMGDRAGITGYVLPYPIIQLEGLVMDRDYLEQLRQRPALLDLMAKYHVRYYIGTSLKPYSGCFQAVEPNKAGEHVPKMRRTFCEAPLLHLQHGPVQTVVYDLEKIPRQ
jgi:hypothetical protein